ncbi:hypothetical protein C0995_015979 [Termitomyces sp. Mi166|nr:hypothetical protein C0995_015979 [Termitomyces sp. Mi166\
MTDLPEEKGLEEDLNEDEQLTIKIPNPKVYMARQSLWIGRRGKPSSAIGSYQHVTIALGLPEGSDDNKAECNYTPKKRRKITSDNPQSPTEQYSSSIGMEKSPSRSLVDFDGHNFYGQNVASAPLPCGNGGVPSSYTESENISFSHTAQTGRFTAEPPPINQSTIASLPAMVPERNHQSHRNSLSYSYDDSLAVHFVPWSNPSFAPLPDFMILQLKNLSPVEFPDSAAFDANLSKLLEGVMPELREKSCLTPEIYAAVYRCLSRGDSSNLSPSMREWASHHHLCSGSDIFYLILSPRENIFQTEDLKREAYRRIYCSHIDDENLQERGISPEMPREMMDDAEFFERVPVRGQIFDILTYAHITHESPSTMLRRIRKLGFVCFFFVC